MISVVVIAVVAAAFEFIPSFRHGVRALGKDVSSMLATNSIGSIGVGTNAANPFGGQVPDGTNTGSGPRQQNGAANGIDLGDSRGWDIHQQAPTR